MDTLAKVKRICSANLGVDENEVTMSASFKDDLGADSLDVVELVMCFEEEFGVEISDEDAERIMAGGVGAVVEYLEKKARKQ